MVVVAQLVRASVCGTEINNITYKTFKSNFGLFFCSKNNKLLVFNDLEELDLNYCVSD